MMGSPESRLRPQRIFHLLALAIILGASMSTAGAEQGGQQPLPLLHPQGTPYHTPLAGEGFRTEVFGREIRVAPRNRRSVSAFDLGVAVYEPPPEDAEFFPIGALYFWHHPDTDHLLRAEIAVISNAIFWSHSLGPGPFEWVLTFNNYTVPVAQGELVDGESLDSRELLWGYVRPGLGLGYRRQVPPGHEDNMLAVDLIFEPGYQFFDDGDKTAADFVVPENTLDLRGHLQARWDAIERNLLDLPHRGLAAGGDLIWGYRPQWEDWGMDGANKAAGGRDYLSATAYAIAAGGVPGITSERHRLLGSLYGGIGHHLDRFTAPRLGGGPRPVGERYGTSWRPVLPGLAIQEFYPDHYLFAVGEYRYEPIFFTYLSLVGSVGWLDRLRSNDGEIYRRNDCFTSLGARVTTGFFFKSRLQIDYNYNFAAIRDGKYGGHEIVLQLSKQF